MQRAPPGRGRLSIGENRRTHVPYPVVNREAGIDG
ncbi:hypothetical protein [Streptosporangium sp. NPDC049644]